MFDGPVGVHLVGSVPLGGAEEVFRRVAAVLGDRLRRIPDGETGPRSDWIGWQYPVFSSQPQFEPGMPGASSSYRALPQLRLRSGVAADGLSFDELGYASAAMSSHAIFARLRDEGVIPAALPLPRLPADAARAGQRVRRARAPGRPRAGLRGADGARGRAHPRRDPARRRSPSSGTRATSSRCSTARSPSGSATSRAGILERLLRLGRHVPPEVELGYHLCYGDEEHGHFSEPQDSKDLVAVANALGDGLERPLNWIHMPVPESRDDDGWFAPMRDLRLRPETELYLGLLHPADRDEGALRRIEAARRHVPRFGVATECGWGRGTAEAVMGLLELHRGVSAPLPDGGAAARLARDLLTGRGFRLRSVTPAAALSAPSSSPRSSARSRSRGAVRASGCACRARSCWPRPSRARAPGSPPPRSS